MQVAGRSTNFAPVAVTDRITGNIGFSSGASSDRTKKGSGSFHGNTFSVKDVQVGGSVAEKQALAKRRAMHVVARAYDNEKRLDQKTAWMRDNADRLQKSITEHEDENRAYNEKLTELRETYGIDPDGEEEKELERLARKMNNPKAQWEKGELDNLTAYQSEALYYRATILKNESELALDKPNRETYLSTIRALDLERSKTDAVGEAQEQAAAIEAASAKDAVAQLTQEARQHVDDESEALREEMKEEREERAAKEKEEKEKKAQEEILEAATERQSVSLSAQSAQALVNTQVDGIINRMNLLTEDIKGAEVDTQL